MATESVATPRSSAAETARQLFGEHPEDVIAMVQTGSNKLYELGGLFEAIGAAAKENSQIQRLVSIGSYVAEDAANMLDERQEHYAKSFKAAQES